jgi:thiol-disulfide isomerase/thioredoxin
VGEARFFDPRGRVVHLSNFSGRLVLLNFWASWCPPCLRELPALDALAGRFADAPFALVAVSLDREGAAAARPFFERLGVEHLTLYTDPYKMLGRHFPVDVLPASFLIDSESRAVAYLRSYADWSAPEADALIRKLLPPDE